MSSWRKAVAAVLLGRDRADSADGPPAVAEGPRLRYLPGVDGLRAIAVIAVLLYHAELPWIRGGFLGVDVFFVISGYLITSLLLAEWRLRRGIYLPAFWLRRARRLLPALFLLIAVALVFAVVSLPGEVAGLRDDAFAALGYVTNWYLIFSEQSYFEMMGRPSLFRHLWSLAVEEQFYILWPPLLLTAMMWLRRPWLVLLAVLGLAAASVLLMALLYQPHADPSRVYYGTDTRGVGLLVGAALAFVWTPGRVEDRTGRLRPLLLDVVGLSALAALFYSFVRLDGFQPFLYQGGFALVALTTAVVIAVAVHPRAHLGGLLGLQPLRWIGLRSYGIYLWHWPVFMLTRPQCDVPIDGLPLLALRFAVTIIMAELSYRFVETPIRAGALGRVWRTLREAQGTLRWRLRLQWGGIIGAALASLAVVALCVAGAQRPGPPSYLSVDAVHIVGPAAAWGDPAVAPGVAPSADPTVRPKTATIRLFPSARSTNVTTPRAPTPTAIPAAEPVADPSLVATAPPTVVPTTEPSPQRPTPPPLDFTPEPPPAVTSATEPAETSPALASPPPAEENGSGAKSATVAPAASDSQAQVAPMPAPDTPSAVRVTAIGDSVMLGAADALASIIGNIEVDAAVGRQASAALEMLRMYRDAGRLGEVVVVHIGNNGAFSGTQFDQMMEVLADVRKVVFVNLKVPREWEGPNNAMLAEAVTRYPNAALVDWHAASVDRPDFFWDDGIHLRPKGAQVYAELIAAYANAY